MRPLDHLDHLLELAAPAAVQVDADVEDETLAAEQAESGDKCGRQHSAVGLILQQIPEPLDLVVLGRRSPHVRAGRVAHRGEVAREHVRPRREGGPGDDAQAEVLVFCFVALVLVSRPARGDAGQEADFLQGVFPAVAAVLGGLCGVYHFIIAVDIIRGRPPVRLNKDEAADEVVG